MSAERNFNLYLDELVHGGELDMVGEHDNEDQGGDKNGDFTVERCDPF